MKYRVIQFDLLKFFAIFLVCYYHGESTLTVNYNINHTPGLWIYVVYLVHSLATIAVPLFFVVNGALSFNKKFNFEKHLKKTLSLFLLYVFWSAITYLLIALLKGEAPSIKEVINGIFYIQIGYNNHLWFLKAMITIYLLFPLIRLAYERVEEKFIIYFIFGILFCFSFGNLFLNQLLDVLRFIFNKKILDVHEIYDFTFGVNPFGNSFFAVAYFILGGLLVRKDFKEISDIKQSTLSIIFVASWLMLFGYSILKSILTDAKFDTVFPAYFSVMTFLMTTTAYLFSEKIEIKNIRAKNLIEKIGASTLGIYLIHAPINAAFKYHAPEFIIYLKQFWLLGSIVYALILLISSYLLSVLIMTTPYIRNILTT